MLALGICSARDAARRSDIELLRMVSVPRGIVERGACCRLLFFFNDTAPTEISPLSLPDALPICFERRCRCLFNVDVVFLYRAERLDTEIRRSEEHTSELQSPYVISYAVFCF